MTRRRIGTLWGVLVAVMLGVTLTDTTEAMAQEQGANLDSFQMGKLQDQLELDVTPVPVGMGALFVPSLTDPTLEPRVIVFSGVDRVASGTTGKRIWDPKANPSSSQGAPLPDSRL